jgi:hypothetical protein
MLSVQRLRLSPQLNFIPNRTRRSNDLKNFARRLPSASDSTINPSSPWKYWAS